MNYIFASTYGEGTYNSLVYSAGTGETAPIFSIGSLPVTGPMITAAVGIAAIAISVGLLVWARNNKKAKEQ